MSNNNSITFKHLIITKKYKSTSFNLRCLPHTKQINTNKFTFVPKNKKQKQNKKNKLKKIIFDSQ